MSLVSNIFKNLNESAEVKKPYGDKPEEGKKESLAKGKKKSVPKGAKVDNKKVPVEKEKNVNKQAKDIYVNDTSKYEDNKDDSKHNDKGDIAKKNTKKATTVVKFPYGQKVEKASTKLVKEEAEVKECGPEVEPGKEPLAEDGTYSYGAGVLKQIYEQYVSLNMEDEFFEDCYNRMDISEPELQTWLEMGESDKVKGKGTSLKEGYSDKEYAIIDLYQSIRSSGKYPSKEEIANIEKSYDTKLSKSDIGTAIEKAIDEIDPDSFDSEEEYEAAIADLEKRI